LSGQAGTGIEQVDGLEMVASFAPVQAHPHTWAIVFLQPADGDFSGAMLYSSPQKRVDIIVSTTRSDGTVILIEERTLHKIQTELAAKFGGLTRYPAFNGSSTGSDGQVHDDINNAGLFVVAPNTPENIEWFSTYKQTLEARLDQDGIFMMICLSAHNCVRAENIDR
jgi:hypothetical protein